MILNQRDEGVIKFKSQWEKGPIEIEWDFEYVNKIRNILFENNFIGSYPDGIGFGNLSIRIPKTNEFIITGSTTGNIDQLTKQDFSHVTQANIEHNHIYCTGETIASSESMTHAVLYLSDQSINAVVHVHHPKLWQTLLNKIPTISKDIPYGTIEMAKATEKILHLEESKSKKIFCMAGHTDGIVAFGPDLQSAANIFLSLLNF